MPHGFAGRRVHDPDEAAGSGLSMVLVGLIPVFTPDGLRCCLSLKGQGHPSLGRPTRGSQTG